MKRLLSVLLIIALLAALALPALAEPGQPDASSDALIDTTKEEPVDDAAEMLAAAPEAPVSTVSGLPEVRITLKDGLSLSTVNSGSKDTKYAGNTVLLVDPDGSSSEYKDVELKGRGNFTWNQPQMIKKPYQIKFDSKTKVFGMDKAKKWVLLANYSDGTLMRNKLAFELAKTIGLPYSPESVWVDLYVNDEYIGNYLLCEKNEVGSNRVPLEDDYGVLCEIDGNYGTSEDVYYKTAKEKTVVVLSESVADDVGEKNSVAEAAFAEFCKKLDRFEALLYNKNASWEQIAELIDVESFIKYYFIQELTEDPDGCRSSFYLWSDGINDVIHLGPVWDFDSAMGTYAVQSLGGDPNVDYSFNIESFMGSSSVGWFKQLFGFRAFDMLATELYNSEIRPVFDSIPSIIDGFLSDELIASAEMNFEKWDKILGHASVFGGNGRSYSSSYESEIQFLKDWTSQRVSYLDSRYAASPALYVHRHTLTKVAGQASTCITAGWKQCYVCSDPYCAEYFEDALGSKMISDIDAWRTGSGALPLSKDHVDADKDGKCDLCGSSTELDLGGIFIRIIDALNPVNIITNIVNSVKNIFSSIFSRF